MRFYLKRTNYMLPLFKQFPTLRDTFPRHALGNLPTPVTPLTMLGTALNTNNLYIKRDDISGEIYGGNKVRKLEFLLGDAEKKQAKRVITSGAAGSNHALATALYATRAGFKTALTLFEQPFSPAIAATLLADAGTGADLYFDRTYTQHCRTIENQCARYEQKDRQPPYLIPAGGSSPIGTIGFVNAAFELREQIEQHHIAEPHAIYMALGTMGSAAGLLLGLRAAGISSKLVAVSVVPPVVATAGKLINLVQETNELLRHADATFPSCQIQTTEITVIDRFLGDGYGITTPKATEACMLFSTHEQIPLDGVYTGKAAAAFLSDARSPEHKEHTLLFWNTKNSRPLPQPAQPVTARQLPAGCMQYF